MTRPGASEVYRLLVPCALATRGRHEIAIRLRLTDNRVTFEDACSRRTAEAHDALARSADDGPASLGALVHKLSCLPWTLLMRDAIKSRAVQAFDLVRCRTCDAIVPLWHNDCPFQVFDQDDGPTHHLDRRAHLAFWNRIVRSGRIR